MPSYSARRNRANTLIAPALAGLALFLLSAPGLSRQTPAPEEQSTEQSTSPTTSPTSEATESKSPPAVPSAMHLHAGLLVFVDPATGEILERPLPSQQARIRQQQAAAIGQQRDRALSALSRFTVPGGVGLDVSGRFQSSLRVHKLPDGTLAFGCVDAEHDHSVTPSAEGNDSGSVER